MLQYFAQIDREPVLALDFHIKDILLQYSLMFYVFESMIKHVAGFFITKY